MSASSLKTTAVYDEDLCIELVCPVCREYMHPPIRQCTTGHSFCHRCFIKINKCPECRVSLMVSVRNFSLENFYAKLMFPCHNVDEGCKEIDVGGKIRDHEMICDYIAAKCPINCTWSGTLHHLVPHFKTLHADKIFFNQKQKFICHKFLGTENAYMHNFFLFNVHEKVFLFAWDSNFETGFMRWCVFLMNEPEDCVEFEFEIEMRKYSDPVQRVVLKGPCASMGRESGRRIFNNHQFVFSHCDMIEEFCDVDDLHYTVEILKREDLESSFSA